MQFDRVALRKELVATMNTLWIEFFYYTLLVQKLVQKFFCSNHLRGGLFAVYQGVGYRVYGILGL